ncbi:beta-1,3-galactosyltransferase 1-like [Salvelinus fontinalis]|uniref:beta-1,3-galactosyltransferase 1-like n=1 Tax=Salvelinus fontinalis TaxID=8038 RepID=UPI0024855302|nr:beta-1,3-galactosyltransferase 1-like [Salvelinus fontinalis]XP_055770518.1 beta-1,3-galactosyltransferase 1-like [Salvelinus fontinalis]
MVEDGTKNGGRSQEMAEGGRYCCWSGGRCRFLILLVTVAAILFFTNHRSAECVPRWWAEYHGRSVNTSREVVSLNSTDFTIDAHETASANSTDRQTSLIHSTQQAIKLNTTHNETSSVTSALTITDLITEVKAVRSTPPPYVSPGPYHVEYPSEYIFILDEPEKCREQNPFLVLMVPVAPYNRDARDAVRSTWGSERQVLGKEVRLFFLLGLPSGEETEQLQEKVLQESKEHQDLLQSDFIDSYKNLTIKTMVMMEWLSSRCPNASYAMKIDSDMFLNVNTLVNMLLHAPKQNYQTGLVARRGAVLRDRNSKWYLPKKVFPELVYPPYALGLGYVFTLDLPRKLVEASRHVKAIYIEDVYLGLCMRHLGIRPTNPPNGNLFQVSPVAYDRCTYSRLIATTTYSITDQVNAWTDLHKPGPPC